MVAHQYDNIISFQHPQIVENRNIKIVLIGGLCIFLGCLIICSTYLFNMGTGLVFALVIMGISGIIFGITSLAIHSKQKVYKKTGSVIKAPIFYFSREYLIFAEHLLVNGTFDAKKTIPLLDNGNVYFYVLSSLDNRFAAVQIFELMSHLFEPISQIYYFEEEQSLKFWEYINRCKTNTKKLKYNLR
jgi:hypothetical protein